METAFSQLEDILGGNQVFILCNEACVYALQFQRSFCTCACPLASWTLLRGEYVE
jgi:hypothetical protein